MRCTVSQMDYYLNYKELKKIVNMIKILRRAGFRLCYSGMPLWLDWDLRCRLVRIFYDTRVWRAIGAPGHLVTIENEDWERVPEACEEAGWQWYHLPASGLIVANPGKEYGVTATQFEATIYAVASEGPSIPSRMRSPHG
jgi:hypothetical protein